MLLGLASAGKAAFAVVVDTTAGPAGLTATGLPSSTDLADSVTGAELPGAVACYPMGAGLAVLLDLESLLLPARIGGS
jgi:hypothetical protein